MGQKPLSRMPEAIESSPRYEREFMANKVAVEMASSSPVSHHLLYMSFPMGILEMLDFRSMCLLEQTSREAYQIVHIVGRRLLDRRGADKAKFKPMLKSPLKSPKVDLFEHHKLEHVNEEIVGFHDEIAHALTVHAMRSVIEYVMETFYPKRDADSTHPIFGMVCDLVVTRGKYARKLANVISRIRPAALRTIVVADMKAANYIKKACHLHPRFRCLVGKLAFIAWGAGKERDNLKRLRLRESDELVALMGTKKEAGKGFIGTADQLLHLRTEHWYLRGVVHTLFGHISIFDTEANALAFKRNIQDPLVYSKFNFVPLDLYEDQIVNGMHFYPCFDPRVELLPLSLRTVLQDFVCDSRAVAIDLLTKPTWLTYYRRRDETSRAYNGPAQRRRLLHGDGESQVHHMHGYEKSAILISCRGFRGGASVSQQLEGMFTKVGRLRESREAICRTLYL